jgi:hypothetical protein
MAVHTNIHNPVSIIAMHLNMVPLNRNVVALASATMTSLMLSIITVMTSEDVF